MASTMIAAPWLMRFAKFPFERNVSPSMIPKITTRTTTPMIAGSEPMSPPLTRVQYSRAAAPMLPPVSSWMSNCETGGAAALMPHLPRSRPRPRA